MIESKESLKIFIKFEAYPKDVYVEEVHFGKDDHMITLFRTNFPWLLWISHLST